MLDFEIIPSPLNKTVEQGVAVFHCQHRSSDDISWRVNGSTINPLNYTKLPLSGGGFSSSLSIEARIDFNRTMVECVAIFFQGSFPFQFTVPVTLIQGMDNLMVSVPYYFLFMIMIYSSTCPQILQDECKMLIFREITHPMY